MSRSKLTLPFSQACKLTDSQKCKLIECQGNRVALEEWEITALLEVCLSNGWIDKGLAVLYEYAGHLDGLKTTIEARTNSMDDVIDFVRGISQQHGLLNTAELQAAALNAASLLVKTIRTLSLWRRLQSCPRPLFIEERDGDKWSFPFLLRNEAKRFGDALFQTVAYTNVLDLLGVECMALLAAPYMDFDSFLELVQYQQKYSSGRKRAQKRTAGNAAIVREEADRLLRTDSPVRMAFEAVREVLELEDRIERTWEALRSLPMFAGSPNSPTNRVSTDPAKLYPVLRLPYRTFRAPTEDLAWFQTAIPRYQALEAVLTAFAKSHLGDSRDGTQPQLQEGPGSALGPMRGTYLEGAEGSEDGSEQADIPEEQYEALAPAQTTGVDRGPGSSPHQKRPAGGPVPGGFVRAGKPVRGAPPAASPTPSSSERDGGASGTSPCDSGGTALRVKHQKTPEMKQLVILTSPFAPRPQSQAEQPPSPFLEGVVVPFRGNNVEPEQPQQSPGQSYYVGEAASGHGSPYPTGQPHPSEVSRKRSVTVAVVEHPEGSVALTAAKDLGDMRRRVTHAGTMSSSSSMHSLSAPHSVTLTLELPHGEQEQQPQQQQLSLGVVPTPVRSPPGLLVARRPSGALSLSRQFSDMSAPLPVVQEEGSPVVFHKSLAAGGRLDLGGLTAPEGSGPDSGIPAAQDESADGAVVAGTTDDSPQRLRPSSVARCTEGPAAPSQGDSASRQPSPIPFTPQPILKQPSFGSDLYAGHLPSQIVRMSSEGRVKTLSFEGLPVDGSCSSSSSARGGGSTPLTPFDRPRVGSYEILYQETPEERMHQPVMVYEGTPSPLFPRKRAQSTPHNLLTAPYRTMESAGGATTASSSANSIPFSPALHLSSSTDALYSPVLSGVDNVNARTALRNLTMEGTLRSAPSFPERKTYRGNSASRPSSKASDWRPQHHSATRNFSARRKNDGDESPHFMETFGMLDTLSKPYTRGESMAESQVLQIALRSMRVEGLTLMQLAARKISVWWKLVAPRRKLLRRLALREDCRAVVLAMADSAVAIGIAQQRRRRSLLRNGAAMKIQRLFRHWCSTILVETRRREREQRATVAWGHLSLVYNVVQVAVRIYRYLRYWQRKRRHKRLNRLSGGFMLQRTIDKYMQMRTLRKKLEQQHQLYTKLKVASIMATGSSCTGLYRERELAVACIQRGYRAYQLHRRSLERQYFNIMCSKITYFFIRCIARRRVRRNKQLKLAAVRIQQLFRGVHTRLRILRIVRSGLLLNALWRKHRAYVSLKSQLRRVDRPHTLIIHGIRNIAKKTINSNQMRFKISVWWHPLLHIVSHNDFNTIIQTKQPQFIFNSENYYLVDTAEPRNNRRMSIKQSLRKLGSMIVPMARRQSALPAAAQQAQSRVANGVFRYSQVLADRSSSASRSARASVLSMYNAMTSRKGTTAALPPIAGARSAAPSVAGPSAPRLSAAESGATAGIGRGSVASRKESVEVLRPSALLAAQLDIIHSDDESGSDANEDDTDGGDDGDDEKSPARPASSSASAAAQVKVPGRSAVTRSFIQNRMGLPASGADCDQPSSLNSELSSSSLSPVPPSLASLSGKKGPQAAAGHVSSTSDSGVADAAAAGAEEEEGPPAEGQSARRWQRLSSVVLNDPNMLTINPDAPPGPNTNGSASPGSSSSPSKSVSNLFLRSTLNFMALGAQRSKSSMTAQEPAEPKMICHFEDAVVKIPGCHGNSVIKFEIFEGDRKYGNTLFYLSKEGEMMFWGGEYQRNVHIPQQRRAVQFNSDLVNARNPSSASGGSEASTTPIKGAGGGKRVASALSTNFVNSEEPILDFRVIAGAALRSKCSWGRVAVRGSGPLKRILKSRDFLSSFLFDKWHRFFFSLDEFGLHLYDNKFDGVALHVIPVADLKEVSVDIGAPIKENSADAAKNIVEDIHNVKVTTFSGDDLYMRFPDTSTRVAWQEALANAILHQKCSASELAGGRKAWVAKAVGGDNGVKGRGMLATALSEENSSEEGSRATTPSAKKPMRSFTDGAGASHFHRLLRLRTERALAPFTGGGSGFGSSGSSRSGSAKAGGFSSRPPPPEVKVIINNQRGSPLPITRKRVAYM